VSGVCRGSVRWQCELRDEQLEITRCGDELSAQAAVTHAVKGVHGHGDALTPHKLNGEDRKMVRIRAAECARG
jgi:hypothetical protein